MIKPENIRQTLEVSVELPIKMVVHKSDTAKFKISIYYECWLKGNKLQRDANSDVPFATWLPKRGISGINFTHILLRDAGLEPTLDKICERTYKTWRKERKQRKARKARKAARLKASGG